MPNWKLYCIYDLCPFRFMSLHDLCYFVYDFIPLYWGYVLPHCIVWENDWTNAKRVISITGLRDDDAFKLNTI